MSRPPPPRRRFSQPLQPIPEGSVPTRSILQSSRSNTLAASPPTKSLTQSSSHTKILPLKPTLVRSSTTQLPNRTSKSSQKLVELPIEPQAAPLPDALRREGTEGGRADELRTTQKSEGERMSKAEREQAGFKRLTAYCVAEGFKNRVLAAFLKREHGVTPRIYDEAMYVLYTLPLLPGYQENINVRSSVPSKPSGLRSIQNRITEAEESFYEGTYFPPSQDPLSSFSLQDGYIDISSSPPTMRSAGARARGGGQAGTSADGDPEHADHDPGLGRDGGAPDTPHEEEPRHAPSSPQRSREREQSQRVQDENVAEVIIFQYGVVVFFGLEERQEKDILEDLATAGGYIKQREEEEWEIEACHYVYDPTAESPRIYNDFFTFKSPSHLLKLSISHAIAQSTLLARFETIALRILSHPNTISIPRQLALTGKLSLRRGDALKLTGRLFKLRRDINLVSNVMDVPELFWSESSLRGLYDAVREYMEIEGRVDVLNEKLGVANDLLDIIHEHLNGTAMTRITIIIIWLIVVACLVELGEVLARLVVHASRQEDAMTRAMALLQSRAQESASAFPPLVPIEDGLVNANREALFRMISNQ